MVNVREKYGRNKGDVTGARFYVLADVNRSIRNAAYAMCRSVDTNGQVSCTEDRGSNILPNVGANLAGMFSK
jgi:hypothetical protein